MAMASSRRMNSPRRAHPILHKMDKADPTIRTAHRRHRRTKGRNFSADRKGTPRWKLRFPRGVFVF
jgi:hypothetical protein